MALETGDLSRSRHKTWIEEGSLWVNGAPVARGRDPVREGDQLDLRADVPEANTDVQPQNIPIDVVYADDAIAIIRKPAGLTVHPGAGQKASTLQNALLHHFPQTASVPRAGIVHRLDKDTSGLLVVALNLKAHAKLVAELQARDIRREYEALVQGELIAGGTIDAPIGRHPRDRLRMAVLDHGGREAVTHYRIEERFSQFTRLRVRLSVQNDSARVQPLPLLRLTLQDRFGNAVATRDLEPREYLPARAADQRLLEPDQRIDAELHVIDPDRAAIGFEIDACLRGEGGTIGCANDARRRASG